ncbi:hypothetical protein [Achromobacter sp. UBA2119]|uniref:hypothetical protein n=1 Tax=Achromobacter sp. UBA2119 TaxID=1945911 RepID=UPI00257E0940|nr:hypothetical protein [Achromobacter sp. UBA2119]
MAEKCKCTFAILMAGDGCRYCQPQTYIDHLEMTAKDYQEYTDGLVTQRDRALAQLRECAETLGADQIDEQRAMRAYADSMKLLEEMPHISHTPSGSASLKERQRLRGRGKVQPPH